MYIYCIENIKNNKCYIGQTKRNVRQRFNEQRYALRCNKKTINHYIQKDWDKYDEENFKFLVLEKGFNSTQELNQAEQFWISYLRTSDRVSGYNIENGSINNKVSLETKKILSKKHSKTVVQYNLNGELLGIYPSIKYVSELFDYRPTGISTCVLGKTKTAYDCQWKRFESDIPYKIDEIKSIKKRKRLALGTKIKQCDLQDNFIREWDSIMDAAEEYDVSHAAISNAIIGKSKTSCGYKWKYTEQKTLTEHIN